MVTWWSFATGCPLARSVENVSTDAEPASELVETLLPLGTAAWLAEGFADTLLGDSDGSEGRGYAVAQAGLGGTLGSLDCLDALDLVRRVVAHIKVFQTGCLAA